MPQKVLFVRKVAGRAVAEGQNSNILTQYLSRLAWDWAEFFHLYLIKIFVLVFNFNWIDSKAVYQMITWGKKYYENQY